MSEDATEPVERPRSSEIHRRARRVLPDGASRNTVIIRPHPIYVESGHGAWITDVDGNRYLDVNNNYTSIILGHADPVIDEAVRAQPGSSFETSGFLGALRSRAPSTNTGSSNAA
ncbi:MAG: aminotransferase class III-fold pyridoxal phosphate-dependent enzyme [Proteobacteria bacterium]|nr:aminotransferase class III-fold pyridoxal phosphate-dependent enzyme [Pseudomonadota bacterium]